MLAPTFEYKNTTTTRQFELPNSKDTISVHVFEATFKYKNTKTATQLTILLLLLLLLRWDHFITLIDGIIVFNRMAYANMCERCDIDYITFVIQDSEACRIRLNAGGECSVYIRRAIRHLQFENRVTTCVKCYFCGPFRIHVGLKQLR
jgi:hypothetical protein